MIITLCLGRPQRRKKAGKVSKAIVGRIAHLESSYRGNLRPIDREGTGRKMGERVGKGTEKGKRYGPGTNLRGGNEREKP